MTWFGGACFSLPSAFFRILLLCLVFFLGVAVAIAQPHSAEKAAGHDSGKAAGHETEKAAGHGAESTGEHGSAAAPGAGMDAWKWANFLLLAGGLGYLIGKNAGPFFNARTQKIRKDMDNSAAARKAAEATAAEVDLRLANLEAEIAALRAEFGKESEAGTVKVREQTAADIAKIQAHAQQEIVSAGKAARMELKRYSAELAVDLAEQKIRSRMTPGAQDELVRSFAQNLK